VVNEVVGEVLTTDQDQQLDLDVSAIVAQLASYDEQPPQTALVKRAMADAD
jgi:hypothetical protein